MYDRQNRLTQIKDGGDSVIASYTYDANGNLLTETKGGEVVTNYTYNANNWLTGKTNKKADNTVLSQYTYTHYRDGNIYQENAGFKKEDDTWQVQNRTYAYDPQGRLKQVTEGSSVTSYTYDLRGNRLTKATGTDTTSYTYDLNNRLLSEAEGDTTTLYEYDDRGNLVSKRKETITSDTTTSDSASILTDNFSEDVELYTYNGFNQLSEYRTGGTRASYVYNAEGIRTSKTVNGNTTQFLLNGANVIGEIGANNQVTHYIRGVSGIIYSIDGSYAQSTRRYYTTNGHGDVVGLLDNTGTLTKSYTYDPFGVEQNIDQADTNPFRYCGEYFDNESKDLYLRARYYNAGTGRFTQQDPAMADGMNWYNYCGGNPVSFVDILGLEKNKVRVFEEQYEVERLEDNAEEGYTLFRFNGKVVKLYWDPAKNNATYGINSTDNTGDGYLEMERTDFLNLFETAFTYEVVEYEIGWGEATARNVMANAPVYFAGGKIVVGLNAMGAAGTVLAKVLTTSSTVAGLAGYSISVYVPAGNYKQETYNAVIYIDGEYYLYTYKVITHYNEYGEVDDITVSGGVVPVSMLPNS